MRGLYILTIGAVIASLGAPAHSPSAGGPAEVPERSVERSPLLDREKRIHTLATREGISDEAMLKRLEAVERNFHATSIDTKSTANHIPAGTVLDKKSDVSKKITLQDRPQSSGFDLARRLSAPSAKSVSPDGLVQHPAAQPTNVKAEDNHVIGTPDLEKPEAHHHSHQEPSHGPCEKAGSPSDVSNCKKAREAMQNPP
jgi:hypothetical protein